MNASKPLRAALLEVGLRHAPLPTSQTVLVGRPALLLTLEREGQWGVGEASPLASFGGGRDSLELARRELADLVGLLNNPADPPLPGPTDNTLSGSQAGSVSPLALARDLARGLSSPAARHAAEGALLHLLERESGAPAFWALAPRGDWPPLGLAQSAVLDPLAPGAVDRVIELYASGIHTIKVKLGRDEASELAALARMIGLGLPLNLRFDPNLAWCPAQARRILSKVRGLLVGSPCALQFVEDPCSDLTAWTELATLAPLAIDEPLLALPQDLDSSFERQLGQAIGAASVLVLKPMALGGAGRTADLAAWARHHEKQVSLSHFFDGPVAFQLCSQLAFALQSPGLAPGLGRHEGLTAWLTAEVPDVVAGIPPQALFAAGPTVSHGTPAWTAALELPGFHEASIQRPLWKDGLSIVHAASRTPDDVALEFSDSNPSTSPLGKGGRTAGAPHLTYRALAARAEARARLLPGSPFLALLCEPTAPVLIELYAAFLVGQPVLLLHPSLPDQVREELIRRAREHQHELEPGDAVLVATSGSTGTPHLVVHTRTSLLAAAAASRMHLGLPETGDRWLLSIPFAHVGGLSVLTRCLIAGASVVVRRMTWAHPDACQELEALQLSALSLVPTQLGRLLALSPPHQLAPAEPGGATAKPPGAILGSQLRVILVGGAACPAALLKEARALGLPVAPSYGMTELGSQIATLRPDQPLARGAVGPLLPGVRCEVASDGRLLVGGPMRMRRYLGEEAALTEAGLFCTSDRGHVHADGNVSVAGRADDVLVSGGENVAPAEIEAALLELALVESACVVGVPDPTWGDRVTAVLVLRADRAGAFPAAAAGVNAGANGSGIATASSSPADLPQVLPEAVRQFLNRSLRSALPRHAIPKAYLSLGAFPLLPSGKVDRRSLASQAALALRATRDDAVSE